MQCVECNTREAEIHLTQIVNNQKITVALCKKCAAKLGFHSPLDNVPFPLAEILTGMSQSIQGPGTSGEEQEKLSCSTCQLTFEEFARQGRFGCGGCYTSFRPRLESIMRKIHGNSLHRGRNPSMTESAEGDQKTPIREEERLKAELSKAIDDEEFERAAELRDKLRTIRQEPAVETPQ